MDSTRSTLEKYSIPAWIIQNAIKNEKGELFEFNKDHFFLFDIAADMSPEQVHKKAAQMGESVLMNLKAFHMARYPRMTTIYTMPSDSDVQQFSKTKTDKIFHANYCISSH